MQAHPGYASNEPVLLSFRKGNAVYHAVKRAILLREQRPGDALVEQSIARRMGCSQGTVREALMRLSEDGLVERRGYKGTIVSNASVAEVAQMVRIRIDLEIMGLKHAASNFLPADGDRLWSILAEMDTALDAGDAYRRSELDRHFHLSILKLSDLASLEPILQRCTLFMHRYTFGNIEDDGPRRRPSEEHADVMQALESHDATAAARAGEAHILRVISRWSPQLHQALNADE
jgi:DNA-binding GntR family transcriptional regulator